ncbi:hypothetical protein GmHk_06G016861 [Glycine max]|nr:hypothetical protein GmHk_06G016861 [Glycine max]
MEGLVDLAAIDAFLAFHHGKESPVVTILAMHDTFDQRCEKSGARIVCCTPALYVWLVSHLFLQEGRPVYPLQGHRSCVEGRIRILSSCEGFPNVPLMGTRGYINYNPVLAIRQLGYPMRGAPLDESITPFITRGFSDPNAKVLQGVRKACDADRELRGSSNGIISGYHKWLRVRTQGLDWLPNLKTVRDDEVKALEESDEVQALKAELERARVVKEKFKSIAIKV